MLSYGINPKQGPPNKNGEKYPACPSGSVETIEEVSGENRREHYNLQIIWTEQGSRNTRRLHLQLRIHTIQLAIHRSVPML